MRPTIIIIRAAVEASDKRSSLASQYTRVASVSKLKGRMINVAGNSRTTSIKTKMKADIRLGRSNGKKIRRIRRIQLAPRDLEAWSIDIGTLENPASKELKETVKKRTESA